MKNFLYTIAAIILLVPPLVLAAPSSVDRITDHIEPLIKTDYVKAPYIFASSTATNTLPVISTASTTISNYLKLANLIGFLKATNGVISTSTISLLTDISGVLAAINGGTGLTSTSTLLYENEIDTSAKLRGLLSDEVGSGPAVFASSTTLTSPTLTSFFGTPCTSNQFLQDISDAGAFFCAEATGSATTSPGGSDGYVQYNNGGLFGGETELFWNDTTNRLGIGTTTPQEFLHVYAPAVDEYTTVRVDNGAVQFQMGASDLDGNGFFGMKSNNPLSAVTNNTVRMDIEADGSINMTSNDLNFNKGGTTGSNYNFTQTGDDILKIQKSGGTGDDFSLVSIVSTGEEATLSTVRELGGSNQEFVDWTIEDYNGLDHVASINVAKRGTGELLPFTIRHWDASLGSVATASRPIAWFDPSGSVALGNYSSTTYSKAVGLQYSSSTVPMLFKLEAGVGNDRFSVASTGEATIQSASLVGKLNDSTNASGTNGMILKSTGTSTQWVATSTLGLGSGSSVTAGDGLSYGTTTNRLSINSRTDKRYTPKQITPANHYSLDSGFTDWYLNGTTSHDGVDYIDGTASIKLQTESDGSFTGMRNDITDVDMSNQTFGVWLKSDNWSGLAEANILISTNGVFDSFYYLNAKSWLVSPTNNEWIYLTFTLSDLIPSGTPNLATANDLIIRAIGNVGTTSTLWVDGLSTYKNTGASSGLVSITFDDANDTQFTTAKPYLDKYNYKSTFYIIPEEINTGGSMTQAQVEGLHNQGHEIAMHGATNLTSFSTSSLQTELDNIKSYSVRYGFGDNFSYPNGGYNDLVREEVAKRFSSARNISFLKNNPGYIDPYYINAVSMASSTATSTMTGMIDEAIANDEWLILNFHDIVTSAVTDTQLNTSKYQAVIDYLKTTGVKVLPVEQVLARSYELPVPINYYEATTSDTVIVNGSINTGEWIQEFCTSPTAQTVQVGADTLLGCGRYSYLEDANGVVDFTVPTTGSSTYFRLRPGAAGTTNAAGDGIGIGWASGFDFGDIQKNQPAIEWTMRQDAVANATSTFVFGGLTDAVSVSANFAAEPAQGFYVIATSTTANWQFACNPSTGGTTYIDTGIASSTTAIASANPFTHFRLEIGGTTNTAVTAILKARTVSNQNMTHIGSCTLNLSASTQVVAPTVGIGKSTAGSSSELHTHFLKTWYKQSVF